MKRIKKTIEGLNVNTQALGDLVRLRRVSLNLSQEKLEEYSGVDQSQIYRLENGKATGSVDGLARIAFVLKMRPGILLDVFSEIMTVEVGLNLAKVEDQKILVSGLSPYDWLKANVDPNKHFLEGRYDLEETAMLRQIQKLIAELLERRQEREKEPKPG